MKEKEFTRLYGNKALFRPSEVADMFSCSLSHIYELVDDETLKVIRDATGGKVKPIRIKRASVLAYLNGG